MNTLTKQQLAEVFKLAQATEAKKKEKDDDAVVVTPIAAPKITVCDEKTPVLGVPLAVKAALTAVRSRRNKVVKNGMIRVTLWQKIVQSQATTALLTTSALQPSSATGFSSFQVVYDECRCLGMTFHFKAVHTQAMTMDTGCVAFDPAISGNLGSVVEALEQKYHQGPFMVLPSTDTNAGMASPTGMLSFSAKTVKSFESGTTNDKIGGNWYPTSVTSAIVGYMKPYLENSAAGTIYLTTYVGYDMEFKYRG